MNQPLIFVGGIHGAGKTTLSRHLAAMLVAEHVTASALIRAAASATDVVTAGAGRKAVPDVDANQERLLRGLRAHRTQGTLVPGPSRGMLLDGHFCLLDLAGRVTEIPPAVFEAIDPVAVLLVAASPGMVVRRLSERDGGAPPLEMIVAFAALECAHATAICARLGIPLYHASGDTAPEEAARLAASHLRPHINAEDA